MGKNNAEFITKFKIDSVNNDRLCVMQGDPKIIGPFLRGFFSKKLVLGTPKCSFYYNFKKG